jgi:hypothetical protein
MVKQLQKRYLREYKVFHFKKLHLYQFTIFHCQALIFHHFLSQEIN